MYDAVVVGSGPNGLAAAVELARNGRSVAVLEAEDTIGGGTRSAELTLPGFVHDVGSAIHPLGYASPFFSTLPLGEHGLEWVHPPAPLAHPFDDGTAAVLERSVEETGETLGPDAVAYRRFMEPLARDFDRIVDSLLGPPRLPRHPLRPGPLRSARAPLRPRARRGSVRGREGARPLRRQRRPLLSADGAGAERRVRPRPLHRGPRRRLAFPEGRLPEDSRRAGLLPALPGRRGVRGHSRRSVEEVPGRGRSSST